MAWRATVGTCEEPGILEHTADGGATWQELPNELAPITRLRVLGTEAIAAIGGGADCEPVYLASSTSGTSWSDESQFLAGSWFLDPADPDRLSTPVGVIDTPCEPVDLVGATAMNAPVLCTDGTLEITADGGASWQETEPDVDARAVGIAGDGYLLAGTHDAFPDGVAVSRTDGAGIAAEPTCAPVDTDADVAVTAVDDAVWLWADDEVTVSFDGGKNW